jgi:A/G-specific adenine glycosylase
MNSRRSILTWRVDFSSRLLDWYRSSRRDLPWRRHHDAYAIWVSEIMLQQTQVDTVRPYFERFIDRFPSIDDLARAPVEDVLTLWSGLGYYRRARHLHAAAQSIVADHDGEFPSEFDRALDLPGVGRYTAGAILSIAYNQSVPIVDGNVERVLCRVLAERRELKSSVVQRRLWREAEALIPNGHARDFNQALMELGALICQPDNPGCDRCPVSASCRARSLGKPERFPVRKPRRKSVPVDVAVLLIRRRARYLMEWREPGPGDQGQPDYLRQIWNFPMSEVVDGDSSPIDLVARVAEARGLDLRLGDRLGTARHTVTFRRITLHVWDARVEGHDSRSSRATESRWKWVRPAQLGTELPVSALAKKALGVVEPVRPNRGT